MRRALLIAGLAALLAPATAGATVSPPQPTGPAAVGFTRLTLVDHSRAEQLATTGGPRRIPLRVWYPAVRATSQPAQVLTAAEQSAYESGFGLPPGALDGLGATASELAPPTRGARPVIVLSHGSGLSTAFHVAQATELASRGFVV